MSNFDLFIQWQQQQLQAKYEDETISRSALPPAGAVSTSVGLDKPFYGKYVIFFAYSFLCITRLLSHVLWSRTPEPKFY